MKNYRIKEVIKPQRVKLLKLKDEKIKKIVKDMIKETTKETECWEEWSANFTKAAKKICGISREVTNHS